MTSGSGGLKVFRTFRSSKTVGVQGECQALNLTANADGDPTGKEFEYS